MSAYLFLSLLGCSWLAAAAIDFSDFNACPQYWLKEYVPPDCDYGSSTQAAKIDDWECLCQAESFFEQSSQAIWEDCGCLDLESTANTLSTFCSEVDEPLSNGADSYISYGDGFVLPCVEPSTGGSKLSVGDIVGIVAGVVGLLALLVGFIQMAVALEWIESKYEPWPQIVKILCCGTIQVENIKTRKTKRKEQEELEKKKKEKEDSEARRRQDLERGQTLGPPAY